MDNNKSEKLKKVFYKKEKEKLGESEILLENFEFEIPIYQRPYAWRSEEVETLLNDLKESKEESYFLGTLVVNSLEKDGEKEKLEVIDGQQRLTTLYLISAVFGDKRKINLSYEIREDDKKFLKELPEVLEEVKVLDKKGFTEEFINEIKKRDIQFHLISENILENLYDILKWRNENKIENLSKLLEKVYFVLAYIPENTDVAKFFEVMNSRGKQLEQHQVLKARFLEVISENESKIYARIWDFCSNMNYYLEDLIYYSLDEKEKKADKDNTKIKKIRENLIKLVISGNSDKIFNYFKLKSNNQENSEEEQTNTDKKTTLKDILENTAKETKEESERKYLPETKEVSSIVKFSVFLLHTLRLFKLKEFDNNDILKDFKGISLDDKKLLETFGDENKLFFRKNIDNNNISYEEIKIAKRFVLFLLKMRILFDYFILKRSNILGKEDIKLRKLKNEDSGLGLGDTDKTLINLQLLFSFTSPNYFQQEWLTSALSWLYDKLDNLYNENENENKDIREEFYGEFINFLEEMDKNLSLERLNDTIDLRKVFKELIKDENYKHENANLGEENIKKKLEGKLNKGTSTEHYWFYKLEYLLWKEFKEKDKYFKVSKNKEDGGLKYPFGNFDYSKIKDTYRLTRKNSIEHIQPQSKANENENGWKKGNNCENECQIDCFGNLALISSYLNSALLDKNFEDKRLKIQEQLNNGTIESLKMLLVYSKYKEWTPDNCKKHYDEMINLLISSLKNSLENKS